jgi:peptidase E
MNNFASTPKLANKTSKKDNFHTTHKIFLEQKKLKRLTFIPRASKCKKNYNFVFEVYNSKIPKNPPKLLVTQSYPTSKI